MMESTSAGRPAHMMGFSDAGQNVLMNNYANWNGRASRSEYWWFYLFISIVNIITLWLMEYGMWYLGFIIPLVLILPILSVAVRRLHDIGKSGWWFLLAIIPIVNFIGIFVILVFMVMEGEEHPNQYGNVPTNTLEHDGNIHTNY